MKTEYKYYKNSNTGEIVMEQSFHHDTRIEFPTNYYNIVPSNEGKEEFDLTGFVEISEKTYQRERKKKMRKFLETFTYEKSEDDVFIDSGNTLDNLDGIFENEFYKEFIDCGFLENVSTTADNKIVLRLTEEGKKRVNQHERKRSEK